MFKYKEELMNAILLDIYNGKFNPYNLPEGFYFDIAKYLSEGVKVGMGTVEMGVADTALYQELEANIYMFSSAKTFQQTLEMSDALLNEKGELRSLKEFKEAAKEIFIRYNGDGTAEDINPGWITAEYNTAITQAGNAKKWKQVEERKHVLPYLRRVAVGDELVCEICGALHNITARVDDPIWNTVAGAAHFNCRCIEEQLGPDEGEENEWSEEEMQDAVELSGMPEEFKYNPGKVVEIFSTEGRSQHPYFSVPKKYQKFAETNFGLPIPDPE